VPVPGQTCTAVTGLLVVTAVREMSSPRWIVQPGWFALAQQCVSTLPAPPPALLRSAQASAHLIVSAGVGGSTAFFFIQAAAGADAPEPAFAHDFLRFASFKDRGIALITQAAAAGAPDLFHTQAQVDRLLSTLDEQEHPQVWLPKPRSARHTERVLLTCTSQVLVCVCC